MTEHVANNPKPAQSLYYHFTGETTVIYLKNTQFRPVRSTLLAEQGSKPETEVRAATAISRGDAKILMDKHAGSRPIFIESLEEIERLPRGRRELFVAAHVVESHPGLKQWIHPYEATKPEATECLKRERFQRLVKVHGHKANPEP